MCNTDASGQLVRDFVSMPRKAYNQRVFFRKNDAVATSACGFLHGVQQEICVSQFDKELANLLRGPWRRLRMRPSICQRDRKKMSSNRFDESR